MSLIMSLSCEVCPPFSCLSGISIISCTLLYIKLQGDILIQAVCKNQRPKGAKTHLYNNPTLLKSVMIFTCRRNQSEEIKPQKFSCVSTTSNTQLSPSLLDLSDRNSSMSAMDTVEMDTAGFTAEEILPLLSKPCNFRN